MGRSSKITAARQQWSRNHTLPAPEEIGIPTAAH
jgi:hypothetical protein